MLIEKLQWIKGSLTCILGELIVGLGLLVILGLGIIFKIKKKNKERGGDESESETTNFKNICSFVVLMILLTATGIDLDGFLATSPVKLFDGMVKQDRLSAYMKIIFDIAAVLTISMTWLNQKRQDRICEYYAMVLAVIWGSRLLVMSSNFIMIFLSLEMISIPSYVLTGFSFNKKGAEASLKYFLFGSIASAIMLYGLSILYGLTGTLDFSSSEFTKHLTGSPLFIAACVMAIAGFLYKIAAAPMHPWSPDVYEASPTPIVGFFSVIPKLAGVVILVKFLFSVSALRTSFDWQLVISVLAMLSLTIGNFSALVQKNPKRMMAYSSIAQAGFLMVSVVAFSSQGLHSMLFYASVYMLANFLIFILLQYFEIEGIHTFAEFSGVGKTFILPSVFMIVGLITLTGLPPTSGFTAKLLIFTSLWEAYAQSNKPILLWLLVFGLLNTVVSLFYYLKIPYYAFLKTGRSFPSQNNLTIENFLAFVLVILLLILFFFPGLLMGWINKITFVP